MRCFSLEEERDSAECGRLHAAEGGGAEEQVMLSQTHEAQVTSDETLYPRKQRIKGRVSQDTDQSWPKHTALIIMYTHISSLWYQRMTVQINPPEL